MIGETICAIASASKEGAISIVRVCGDSAYEIALAITGKSCIEPRYATLSYARDALLNPIDSVIVLYFKAPNSFNGEDIVEFQCHGGVTAASMILDRCLECGARLAERGEFTRLAVLNSKITFAEAEAMSALISSDNEKAAKYLAKHLQGSLGIFVEEARKSLIEALAFSEVCIDYADEDLPEDLTDRLLANIETLAGKLEEIVRASEAREGLFLGFKACIIGKPNVGKSSLLNKMLNFDRAIVSHIAGTTRDTIEERIKIGGYSLRLIDTAGIRRSDDEIEKIGIEYSVKAFYDSDIVLAVFDYSRQLDAEDEKILDLLSSKKNQNIIVILNKTDLPPAIDEDRFARFTSIKHNKNISSVKIYDELHNALDQSYDFNGDLLINKRQIEAAKLTLLELEESKKFLRSLELEFFSFHIKEAILRLSSITEPYQNDEMLDAMFSNFCLGK